MNFKSYLVGLVATFLICLSPFLVIYAFLIAAKEHYTVDRVVEHQSSFGGLYGTAIHNSEYAFKMEIFRRSQPRVIAIGSSRVLQVKGEFFKVHFANMGRVLLDAQSADRIFDRITAIYKPDVMIIGVDFWWFSGNYTAPDRGVADRGGWVDPSNVLKVLGWLRNGQLTVGQIFDTLDRSYSDIGAMAVLRRDGFDRFGARVRTSLATGKTPAVDREFRLSLTSLQVGRGNFPHGPKFDEGKWKILEDALVKIREAGIDVVVFLPPVAPAVLQEMMKEPGLNYVQELRARIARLPVPGFDFTGFKASECQFYDGVHAGVSVYARIMQKMAAAHPFLAEMINQDTLIRTIVRTTMRASDTRLDGIKAEIDFLGLGCAK